MNKIIKLVLTMFLTLMITGAINAQFPSSPGGPGSGAPGAPGIPSDNGAVPFDGGLSIVLLAAGAGLASKKKHFTKEA